MSTLQVFCVLPIAFVHTIAGAGCCVFGLAKQVLLDINKFTLAARGSERNKTSKQWTWMEVTLLHSMRMMVLL